MSKFEIIMPKLGESIQEGTITKWFVKEGDKIEEDDMLFEVATDKVDSEIPSPVDGIISEILFPEESLVAVGTVVAVINTGGEGEEAEEIEKITKEELLPGPATPESATDEDILENKQQGRFYSPLVMTIAKEENIPFDELDNIRGTGSGGRVSKKDILQYLEQRESRKIGESVRTLEDEEIKKPVIITGEGDKVVEMDRIRKLIAEHMVMSKRVSPHVTTVVEADVTDLVYWRNQNKEAFQKKYGEKITFMPFFIEAAAAALAEFPMVNSSVDGDKIVLRKNINIGIAVAKNDGNLIVPVIKNAEQMNIVGLTKELNRLAEAARNNKLNPEEIQGGTFTITNFGTFKNLMGTPIINQPQVAILATGNIEKKPAVLELPTGDVIAIRYKMYLSLSYDHRVVDGALGGAFLRKIADNLEGFNINSTI
ncbi:MAG: 2-oxo acid dehydrogenase subunit E2 [Bacteroidales bacterium]|nr:2-oxo acid dehydrogenase subunit E2 [Bacteroidales bacterium]